MSLVRQVQLVRRGNRVLQVLLGLRVQLDHKAQLVRPGLRDHKVLLV